MSDRLRSFSIDLSLIEDWYCSFTSDNVQCSQNLLNRFPLSHACLLCQFQSSCLPLFSHLPLFWLAHFPFVAPRCPRNFTHRVYLFSYTLVKFAVSRNSRHKTYWPQPELLQRHISYHQQGDVCWSYSTEALIYYGFQTVCKCPFRTLLVTMATDSNQTWAN